jgi:glycosyltransferase involved in cell wall biosynthesis
LAVYGLEVDPTKRVIAPWWCQTVKYIDAPCGILSRFANVRKFLAEYRPVVHFHGVWYPQYLPYFFLAFLTNCPFIISPHGSYEPGALNQKFLKKYLARKLCFDRIVSRAAVLWACSEREGRNLKREFPNANVNVVPIGVDIPDITISKKTSDLIDQRKIMLVVCRLNPGKGLLNLVNAWNLIKDENWRIIIAGPDENNHQKQIEREIDNLDLTRFFSFPGYVDAQQREALYKSSDFFVLPSLSEQCHMDCRYSQPMKLLGHTWDSNGVACAWVLIQRSYQTV